MHEIHQLKTYIARSH